MAKKYLSLERLKDYDALIKAEIESGDSSTLSSAKSYADTKMSEIQNGTIVVKEAEHADSADNATNADHSASSDSATKATQDGNGNVISDVYETKVEAQTKYDTLVEAKPDWNQNDETAIDYIKNRPFYEELAETVILEETTFEGNRLDMAVNLSTFAIGEVYTVIFDGITYNNLVCADLDGLLAIGASDFSFSDCPFVVGINDGEGIVMTPSEGTHTIKVVEIQTEIVSLDPKYLPEHLQFGEEINIKEIILPTTEVTLATNGSSQLEGGLVDLEVGKTYSVVWNGIEYNNLVCSENAYGQAYIGNTDHRNAEDGDVPFLLTINNTQNPSWLMIDAYTFGKETVSFSISEFNSTVKTLDEKYIPDTIARTEYVDANFALKSDLQNIDLSEYETKTDAQTKLDEAIAYADSAASTVKNDLLNGAGAAYDTLKELGDLIDDNKDAIEALETIASGKANATHSHAISDVSGLQSALDGKAASSHGTHVTFDSTNKPKMDGTAAFGTSTKVARADHVHPTDTSRASQTDLDALETVVAGKANSSHTHAISDVANLQTTLDTLEESIDGKAASSHSHTITATATDDDVIVLTGTNGSNKVTFDAKHATSGVTAGTYRSVTVNAQGHVTAGTNPTTLSGYGITDAASKTHTHAISDITNLQTTLNNASSAISANTSSIDAHTTKITALETKVGDGFEEITSAEIQALFA